MRFVYIHIDLSLPLIPTGGKANGGVVLLFKFENIKRAQDET